MYSLSRNHLEKQSLRLHVNLRWGYNLGTFIGKNSLSVIDISTCGRSMIIGPSHNGSANEALKFETSALINVLLL